MRPLLKAILFLFLVLLGNGMYAQQTKPALAPGIEKFQYFDTSWHLLKMPLTGFRDSFVKMATAAENEGDIELALSIRLYIRIREAGDRKLSADSAEYHLLKLAEEAHEHGFDRLETDAIQALGDFYNEHGLQSAAIEQYVTAYAIYKKFYPREYPRKQYYVYKMGLAYYKYQDYRNAIIFLKEALYLKQASEIFPSIANTIGLAYRNTKAYDSAIFYFQLVHDTALKRDEQAWVGIALGNIGITYYNQKKYAEAEPLLKKDIASSLANSSISNAVNSMVVLATVYFEQDKRNEAKELLFTALYYCHKKSFWSDCTLAEKIYELLYKIYGTEKNYRLSNLYADSAMMAKDSAAMRYNRLVLSQSYEKQSFIRKKLANERLQNRAKLEQVKKFDQQQLLYKFTQ